MRTLLALAATAALIAGCGPAQKKDEAAQSPAVALPASTGLSLDGRLAAVGTEPFWRLDVTTDGLVFTNAAGVEMRTPYVAPIADETGAVIASGAITLRLLVEPCSDGMSEATYPMRAALDVKGVGTFKGCGYARWDNSLEAMLPAIDACLGQTTEPSPVIFAARTATGALVRLASVESADRFDCAVDGAGIAVITPTEAAPFPGERDPTFTRAPADAPPPACAAVEMKGKDGALLGWETLSGKC